MKEAKENMANNTERLKEDIQNMLFEQKHEILGSISALFDKQKSTDGQTHVKDGDNDDLDALSSGFDPSVADKWEQFKCKATHSNIFYQWVHFKLL